MKITELVTLSRAELSNTTADWKPLLKTLQKISNSDLSSGSDADTECLLEFITTLWNHHTLLDDCILVSGIIFAKLHSMGCNKSVDSFVKLCEIAKIPTQRHQEWVKMALVRGFLLSTTKDRRSKDFFESLYDSSISALEESIKVNRVVLISRHLENILQIFTTEFEENIYCAELRGQQILSLVTRTLRLKSDLIEYKSRDLIKWHLNILQSSCTTSSGALQVYCDDLFATLPEMSKVTLQIFDFICCFETISPSFRLKIFYAAISSLNVKGLSSIAGGCISKIIAMNDETGSVLFFEIIFKKIFENTNSSSKDLIGAFKLIFLNADEKVKERVLTYLKKKKEEIGFGTVLKGLLLALLSQSKSQAINSDSSVYLSVGDEFVCLEAFSLLVRDNMKAKRKLEESFNAADLLLFKRFIEDVSFSGSTEFRQKVTTIARSFYDQIFGRIYYLTRQRLKLLKNTDAITCTEIELISLIAERDDLFNFLADFFKNSLILPWNFCKSNFSSVEFVFRQIIHVLSTFEGNPTLSDVNTQIINEIDTEFKDKVVRPTMLTAADKFIDCVGLNTFDFLRLLASEIIVKSRCISVEIIPIENFVRLLYHPRAVTNEGAARIIQLHAQLSGGISPVSRIIDELCNDFGKFGSSFPTSLKGNNINGKILLLRFLIQDRRVTLDLSEESIEKIIKFALEVSNFVSNIASHPSPEGLNLSDQVDLLEQNEEEQEFDQHQHVDINSNEDTISSQYVLSFSWRAVKETSLLLEALCLMNTHKILKEQFKEISEHFIDLMLKLRHRGAFSAVEGPLSTILRLGFTFPEKEHLLRRILKVCLETGEITTTRRSAGLPHLILALIHSTVKSAEIDGLLGGLILPLIKTGNRSDDPAHDPAIVHSFNIIRSLVRDAKVVNEIGPYLGRIAELCLNSFNSPHWSVRNASSMLLSSLIIRIFGSSHINDLESDSHHVDLREIEVKFVGLISVIEKFLQLSIASEIEPRIAYPLLAILERVKIPLNERFDSFRSLIADFLCDFLEKLEVRPDCGRKLVHVASRTIYALLQSGSIDDALLGQRLLSHIPKSRIGIYNILVVFEQGLKKNIPLNYFTASVEDSLKDSHPILQRKYKNGLSHKSGSTPNFPVEIGSPVESLLSETKYKRISDHLNWLLLAKTTTDGATGRLADKEIEIIHKLIDKFKLNEEIIEPALKLLCLNIEGSFIDLHLKDLLTFYASYESNENIRRISLGALECIKDKTLLLKVPQCILFLLFDDDEGIRLQVCELLSPLWSEHEHQITLNLCESVRKYLSLAGQEQISIFIQNYQKRQEPHSSVVTSHKKDDKSVVLFEKEPLNSFIDLSLIKFKFLNKN